MNWELALFIVSALLIIALVYIFSLRNSCKRNSEVLQEKYDKDMKAYERKVASLIDSTNRLSKDLIECQKKK